MNNRLKQVLSMLMVLMLTVTSMGLPVYAEESGAVYTIKEALALEDGTENVTIRGTLAYFATSYSNPVIHAEIDGEVYALYVYGSAPDGAKIGDEIELTGTFQYYNGLPQIGSIKSSKIIGPSEVIPAAEMTVAEIMENGLNHLGRLVKIKDVTLGEYDGGGNTQITDATGSINIYKAIPYPVLVEEGDVVDVYAMIATYKTSLQLYTGPSDTNGYHVYDVVTDTKAPVVELNDFYPAAKPNLPYTITVKAADNKGIESVYASYAVGNVGQEDQLMTFDEADRVYELTIPGTEIPATGESLEFTIKAVDAAELETVSDKVSVEVDSTPQFVALSPERNAITEDDYAPIISVELINQGTAPEVTLTLTKDDVEVLSAVEMASGSEEGLYAYATSDLEAGQYKATVVVTRADGKSSVESWNFIVGTPEARPFFGQLHAHTAEYSDGSGTLSDALTYLKSISASDRVDFISITDHSNYFDTTSAANPAEALNDKTLMTPESLEKWNTYVQTMRDFNEDNFGKAITLPGFEMTWSGGPGHINTFNSDGLVSRNNNDLNSKSNDAGMQAYYDMLIQDTDPMANLSQFNHPGTTFGTFSDFAYWSPSYDNKMVAVEVGNGEGAIDSGGYFASYAEYTKALDKGWHVAPTNNQDNHKGKWGNSNTARTVIITDTLSEDGLLKGLKNMSVYATEDHNLNITYTVNDQMLGSIIAEVPTEALKFSVNVSDPDDADVISKIDIITNGGRIAASKSFEDNSVEWDFELEPDQGYYYVRVTQADKHIAVTAPVWIGQAPLVGVSSFDTTTKMPVTNEALTLEATLFNNEFEAAVVKEMSYSVNGDVVETETLNQPIDSASVYKYSLDYTPSEARVETVVLTATIEVNGESRQFTQTATLNVRDSEKLIYIGIDASHNNEYVRGNYKDSMGNFATMAVDFDVRVVELETREALLAATQNDKYEMLIFTPPTRRDGRDFLVGYSNYSDEEIEAIKAFAESGKTVIVTGWSDYYENYEAYTDGTPYALPAEDQMSAQQNRLLKALGSSLRIADDQIKDDVNNGGQPQRLYLEEYNLDNPFLEGVLPGEQVYSNYGGASIYAVDGEGMPTKTLAATVNPMVYGFETSESSDSDGDGTTGIEGVEVPKYDNKHMVAASETVSYGETSATIIAAGAAFMSNFEIQVALDSYSTPAYSNFTILENVVASVNPVVVTDIKAVHAAEEGEKFTIEGIATSNASGYDKETAFFDTIYVQDASAGINVFPVAGDLQAGQTVRITGTTSSYNGERQLNVEKITIVDQAVKALPEPIKATAEAIELATYLGSLVEVSGRVSKIDLVNGVVESIYVTDASGETCRVFIDGYITKDKEIENLVIDAPITAVGLSSIDAVRPRIRVRDRADVVISEPESLVIGHWSEHTIRFMSDFGDLVNMDTMDPDAAVTKGDFKAYVEFFRDYTGIDWSESVYNQTLTRLEAMLVFADFLEVNKRPVDYDNRLDTYSDKDLIPADAVDAVSTVLNTGTFNGVSETELAPNRNITHAETLQALYNLMH
ncbi:CehA/McbA family metallohydrolase [Fusibacter tunisiensis]|uniref:SLH domain-containing protein n=1 Tax=Fusibacter tunisiensis TaxID=1008308 RepID=A0ABS2MN80_9FIRM|nr:CehA/McbA family metallohydrolase [Fusibacter tunisiensis]MBM7560866.1 hypothetical protein [Fusibacter tunisiensis]